MEKELIEVLRSMLKEELQPIREDINGMKEDIDGMKKDIDGMKKDIDGMKKDIDGMKKDINGTKEDINEIKDTIKNMDIRLTRVEEKTDNNTTILESINKNVNTLAEVQSSFQEQLGRSKKKEDKSLSDRLEVIELAVTDTSSRVKDIQKDLARVVRTTGENWADIIELKSVK